MYTIGDMQNEKYFYNHHNEIEYNHDYEKYWNTHTFIKQSLTDLFNYMSGYFSIIRL